MASNLYTTTATEDDFDSILLLTNEAFMADAFFKKDAYHLRFDLPTVREMFNSVNSKFIIARKCTDDIDMPCGSIFFHWEIDNSDEQLIQVTGKFSAVSVPSKFEKQGIGKALVKAAEAQLIEIAQTEFQVKHTKAVQACMEMGVINQRNDLFPWYEAQGYKIVGEIRPNDAELLRICLDDIDICCILMRKTLQL